MEDGRLLILLNLGEEYMGDLHSFLSTLTCLKVPIIKSRTKRKEKKTKVPVVLFKTPGSHSCHSQSGGLEWVLVVFVSRRSTGVPDVHSVLNLTHPFHSVGRKQ